MLKEILAQQKQLPRSEMLRFPEYIEQSINTFDAFVDLLRDSKRFPNNQVNELVTLGWRLIGNKITPVVLDQWGTPTLSFAAMGKVQEHVGVIIMPTNYIDLVREDPVMQLGAIVFTASQARDYYTGKMGNESSHDINKRARAFEADALNTLDHLAQGEGLQLEWNTYQQAILAEFPRGLEDLAENLRYPTPPFPVSFA